MIRSEDSVAPNDITSEFVGWSRSQYRILISVPAVRMLVEEWPWLFMVLKGWIAETLCGDDELLDNIGAELAQRTFWR